MRQATDNGTIVFALPALGFIWGLGLSVWWIGRRTRRGRR